MKRFIFEPQDTVADMDVYNLTTRDPLPCLDHAIISEARRTRTPQTKTKKSRILKSLLRNRRHCQISRQAPGAPAAATPARNAAPEAESCLILNILVSISFITYSVSFDPASLRIVLIKTLKTHAERKERTSKGSFCLIGNAFVSFSTNPNYLMRSVSTGTLYCDSISLSSALPKQTIRAASP